MEPFRLGHSPSRDWRDAADDCAMQLGTFGRPGGLGFVYATDAHADRFAEIVEILGAATGVERWLGTVGIGVCASGVEYFDRPGLVAMVGDFPAGAVTPFAGPPGAGGGAPFGIVHGDPRRAGLLDEVEATARTTGSFLVGALTSSRGAYAQIAGARPCGDGLSGALFSGDVAVATGLTQGCSPIGPVRTVTACQGTMVATIDGAPAIGVLAEDMARGASGDARRRAAALQVAFPIPGSDTGDYVVRNLIGLDQEAGALAVAHEPAVGDPIQFCVRDAAAARTDLGRMLGALAKRAARPAGGVYFSCLARGPNLFGPGAEEMHRIAETFPDLPVVGFFGNGEFSAGRLYTYTGVLALFL